MYARHRLQWDGNRLYHGSRVLASLEAHNPTQNNRD
jgi:hypothetical protein